MAGTLVSLYSDGRSDEAKKLRDSLQALKNAIPTGETWTAAQRGDLIKTRIAVRDAVETARRKLASGTTGPIGSSNGGAGGLTVTSVGDEEQRTLTIPAKSIVRITIEVPPVG